MEFGQVDHKEMEIVVLSILKVILLEDVLNCCTDYLTRETDCTVIGHGTKTWANTNQSRYSEDVNRSITHSHWYSLLPGGTTCRVPISTNSTWMQLVQAFLQTLGSFKV